VARALTELPEHPMVAGFHLEGPFISPKYPGAQPPSAIVDPPVGATTWDPILDDPRLRLVTLAPERPNAVDLTARLAAKGVRVSMGHTAATYAEAMEGHRAGVVHATHTYNAMRGLHHREPGALGFVLDTDGVDAELIYDRKHVAREAASVLLRCKGADRVIAVSDSTLASGTAPGRRVQMWDLEAIVGEGEVRLADGTLAGSAITLLDAFRNLLADFGPEVAIKACSINPRRALGLGEPRVWLEIDRQGRILTIWRSDR
jgi:N-acetylglucosamine-6-phosphate deacetylase